MDVNSYSIGGKVYNLEEVRRRNRERRVQDSVTEGRYAPRSAVKTVDPQAAKPPSATAGQAVRTQVHSPLPAASAAAASKNAHKRRRSDPGGVTGFRDKPLQSSSFTASQGQGGVAKGLAFSAAKGASQLYRTALGGVQAGVEDTASSDNTALSGVGHAARLGQSGVRAGRSAASVGRRVPAAGRYTVQGVRTTARAGVRTGQTALRLARLSKVYGPAPASLYARALARNARVRVRQAAIQTGKSAVTAAMRLGKAVWMKLVIPLLLIIAATSGMYAVTSAPVMAVGAVFGGAFSTNDTGVDYDVRDYLTGRLIPINAAFTSGLLASLQADMANPDIHLVRLYGNTGYSDPYFPGMTSIQEIMPAEEELMNMIHPLYNAVLLMEYELTPTEAEAQALLERIYGLMFHFDHEGLSEHCGQSLDTGEGTATAHSCGAIHAQSGCPNPATGIHSSYTCDGCCYYYCDGHTSTDGDGTTTSYCSGHIFACAGYAACGGHTVSAYHLNVDGIYQLENEYFLGPIDRLASLTGRTADEEARLQALKDYHEIYIEMMTQVLTAYGGGITLEDLSGVVFVDGPRRPGTEVINLALSQVGNVGGQPYWSYYGFGSRVEWCACFVHWCMYQAGYGAIYARSTNNAGCIPLINWFSTQGQWGSRSYADVTMGDCIFFDWEGDGLADHIGLVIGRDESRVYVVEGNSGDVVRLTQYALNSSVIYGYGLMNYP